MKTEALKQALKYIEETQLGGAEVFKLLDIIRESLEQPEEPIPYSVLREVERSIQNGSCYWEIETAFEEYEKERRSMVTKGKKNET